MEQIVISFPWATISHLPHNRMLKLVWHGKPDSDEYKQTFLSMLDFGKRHAVRYLLSDIREQAIISPADRKWFQTVAFRAAVEGGLIRAATITDYNPFKKYYLNMIMSFVKTDIFEYKLFADQQEAIAWLLAGEHMANNTEISEKEQSLYVS